MEPTRHADSRMELLEEPAEGTAAWRQRCEELEAELRLVSAEITAAQARFLGLLGRYDSLRGWAQWGARSAVDWLSNHCGHGPSLARTELGLAHALEDLPRIRAAMASGEVSMDKARALAAVASSETEEELLSFALETTTNQLNRALAAARRAMSTDEAERIRRGRFLDTCWDADGSLRIRGRLSPEEGALFRKALQAARETLYREARSTGFEDEVPAEGEDQAPPDPTADADDKAGAARADALVALAESFLSTGHVPRACSEAYQVIVHIDAATLLDDGEGRCHIANGPALAADTVRRLACGASLVWLACDKTGQPVAASQMTQDIPTSVRRAVKARDKGCVFPGGCGMPVEFCDVHHVIHRRHDGPHTTRNCHVLCRFHHHQVHEGGFSMEVKADGTLEVRRPDGSIVPSHAPPMRLPLDPMGESLREGPTVDPNAGWARSNGERMDLGLAVDGLLGLGLFTAGGP